MIRSVNVFKSTNPNFPVRIEFWENDQLIELFETKGINETLASRISQFISA